VSEISIEWLTDYHNCETCGSSYAEGAVVSIDGQIVLEMRPVAHCFGGTNYYESDVYGRILQHLGHTISGSRDGGAPDAPDAAVTPS
jgi:hypothetical protein